MDKMQEYEIADFYSVLDYTDYQIWEQTRLLLSCHVDHKKVKKLTDIMKFPWDKDYSKQDKDIEISNEDVSRLRMLAQKQLDKNKIIEKTNGKYSYDRSWFTGRCKSRNAKDRR